ncbi:MAG: hypothetical protein EPN37_08310 [Chitinophagaceae bacterium]|nr:MAG: hypothetical protein EPN37_08310 [Chitinophagaceae bacterium]
MNEFLLAIRNPYARSNRFPEVLLHFTAAFLLVNAWYEAKAGHYPGWVAVIFSIFAVLEILYAFFSRRLQRKFPHSGSSLRLSAGIAFMAYAWVLFRDHDPVFGIFMIIIGIAFFIIYRVEERWNKPFIIRVNKDGIMFPKIFKSQLYPWSQFNHIILRDDLLTLDFINNRIVQLSLSHSENEKNTIAFNAFCEENLAPKQ